MIKALDDMTAELWSAAIGRSTQTFSGHRGYVCSAVSSGDGAAVLTPSMVGTVKLWSTATGECTQAVSGHDAKMSSAAFSGDGSQCSQLQVTTAKLWSTATGECTQAFSGHRGYV